LGEKKERILKELVDGGARGKLVRELSGDLSRGFHSIAVGLHDRGFIEREQFNGSGRIFVYRVTGAGLEEVERMKKQKLTVCAVDGCDRPRANGNRCREHYNEYKREWYRSRKKRERYRKRTLKKPSAARYKGPVVEIKAPGLCRHPGCKAPRLSWDDYCREHYLQNAKKCLNVY